MLYSTYGKQKMITQKLFTSTKYPCIKDELLDADSNEITVAVFTRDETEIPLGIWISTEGVYEIVIAGSMISKDILLQSLEELTEITGIEYEVNFGS